MKKAGGTTRGVFAVGKDGKVLVAEPGGPAATVEAVKKIVSGTEGGVETTEEKKEEANGEPKEAISDVAAQVADTAAKVDSKEAAA